MPQARCVDYASWHGYICSTFPLLGAIIHIDPAAPLPYRRVFCPNEVTAAEGEDNQSFEQSPNRWTIHSPAPSQTPEGDLVLSPKPFGYGMDQFIRNHALVEEVKNTDTHSSILAL